jgi:hypothetical protein
VQFKFQGRHYSTKVGTVTRPRTPGRGDCLPVCAILACALPVGRHTGSGAAMSRSVAASGPAGVTWGTDSTSAPAPLPAGGGCAQWPGLSSCCTGRRVSSNFKSRPGRRDAAGARPWPWPGAGACFSMRVFVCACARARGFYFCATPQAGNVHVSVASSSCSMAHIV